MITIKEELENYSFSKYFSRFYYYFKSHSSSNNNNVNKKTISSNKENENGANNNNSNNKKSPSLLRDSGNNNINEDDDSTATLLKNSNGCCGDHNKESIIKKTKYSLNNYSDTPDHLRRPFILEGYRVDFSYWLAFKSIFIFGHNDISNIYSHLIPAIYFIYTLYGILVKNNYNITETPDKVMFGIFLGSAICTFICSVLYHTFGCHSYSTYKKLLLCDYLGIVLLIGSSFYPSLFYTYKCHANLMVLYLFTITFLCFSLCALIFVPRFQELHTLRNSLFCATALFGVFPAIHTFFIFDYSLSFQFIKRIITMFLIFGLGLFFYIYKIPESIWPKAGLYHSSHSFWHWFTALGPLYHLDTCLLLFEQVATITCPI
ncbi:hypothetical protein DICPUDRAFT_35083 [Dictyostelium purpureum]|uniref:Uncharacterized protein n=1 Tax=Dictyostelium purpureum TaxID=5786 RepID=F0ZNS2_DICPU|nr:uncharacterized protein DICPUDRAFT_35083 [Dictyostelium purpureum]EGC34402.1 hypothetical protein DICPUDRAFT_35083 [Dictyostelium purpureum]|eukprot:XP_003289076.1 hypothetical protein DICPUDRAFT_35083 [Dictyostelium purpureum]